jgi:squalene cyclase
MLGEEGLPGMAVVCRTDLTARQVVAAGDPLGQLLPSDERGGTATENEGVPDAEHDSDARRHVGVSLAEHSAHVCATVTARL